MGVFLFLGMGFPCYQSKLIRVFKNENIENESILED